VTDISLLNQECQDNGLIPRSINPTPVALDVPAGAHSHDQIIPELYSIVSLYPFRIPEGDVVKDLLVKFCSSLGSLCGRESRPEELRAPVDCIEDIAFRISLLLLIGRVDEKGFVSDFHGVDYEQCSRCCPRRMRARQQLHITSP